MHKNILIISDIEGSSCCTSYASTTFLHPDWPDACKGMSLDVNAVVTALFNAGAKRIYVKDFHRTAYNILPELIDKRARVISGYRIGPVPGLGNPFDATAVMMIGMHAPSGSDGFLPHTLTSRISRLEVNGRLMSEVQLFASSLAPFGIAPIFFSGCPVACRYASNEIKGLSCYPIDKFSGNQPFNPLLWRSAMAEKAADSIYNDTSSYQPEGKFTAVITLRDGESYAKKLSKRWHLDISKDRISFQADNMEQLYYNLIRICYFTPLIEKILPAGLSLFNLRGRAGLSWVRSKISKSVYD
jgi:D-amino peptidase